MLAFSKSQAEPSSVDTGIMPNKEVIVVESLKSEVQPILRCPIIDYDEKSKIRSHSVNRLTSSGSSGFVIRPMCTKSKSMCSINTFSSGGNSSCSVAQIASVSSGKSSLSSCRGSFFL